jgi:hypothetical protein
MSHGLVKQKYFEPAELNRLFLVDADEAQKCCNGTGPIMFDMLDGIELALLQFCFKFDELARGKAFRTNQR